jgi:hypothetical protein
LVTTEKREPIEETDEGFTLNPTGEVTPYYNVVAAASMIGIHPQSLERLWRNSGLTAKERTGIKVGRMCYFSLDHLASLGYGIKKGSKSD